MFGLRLLPFIDFEHMAVVACQFDTSRRVAHIGRPTRHILAFHAKTHEEGLQVLPGPWGHAADQDRLPVVDHGQQLLHLGGRAALAENRDQGVVGLAARKDFLR